MTRKNRRADHAFAHLPALNDLTDQLNSNTVETDTGNRTVDLPPLGSPKYSKSTISYSFVLIIEQLSSSSHI